MPESGWKKLDSKKAIKGLSSIAVLACLLVQFSTALPSASAYSSAAVPINMASSPTIHDTPGLDKEKFRKWLHDSEEKMTKIVLDDGDREVNLDKYTDYLEDTGGTFAARDFLGNIQPTGDWKAYRAEKVPSFGITDSVYWIRYFIENRSSGREYFYIELAYHFHDFVELHVFSQEGKYKVIKTGDHYPYYHRPIDHHNFVFPLDIPKSSKILILLRVKTSGSMLLPLKIWEPETF
ncbi:MAG: hypothetical protein HQK54_18300, partial [Oligoflexales bacterium]|nr:hypothetical protein [Oligoflexales bacterium]